MSNQLTTGQDPGNSCVDRALTGIRGRSSGTPLPRSAPISINFHPDWAFQGRMVIESLALEGTYRSQFETGISNGGLTAHHGGDRWRWESRIFEGVYDEAAPGLRPKYGALNVQGRCYGGSPRFGSAHLRLHPRTLARTTFCFPDSHFDPQDFGVADRMGLLSKFAEVRGEFDILDQYVEAHIHGTVQIAVDVEALVLDASYRGTEIEHFAGRMACPVEWHPGFRMPISRLPDCATYRGDDVAVAARLLSRNGELTPRDIGLAQQKTQKHSQTLRRVWHCLARFGAPADA